MYYCKPCSYRGLSLKNYVKHMNNHRYEYNFKFHCGISGCTRIFFSFNAFNVHITRIHKELRYDKQHYISDLKCNQKLCHKTFTTVRELITHIKSHLSTGGYTQCCFKGCTKRFKTKSAFSTHFYRYHHNCHTKFISPQFLVQENFCFSELCRTVESTSNESEETDPYEKATQDDSKNSIIKSMALFCLLLESKCLIPSKTVQIITNEILNILNTGSQFFLSSFSGKLASLNIFTEENIENILKCAQESQFLNSLFHDHTNILKSPYLRQQYFETHLNYVKPIQIKIGTNKNNVPRYFHYVPIKETLIALLKNDSVRDQILKPKTSNSSNILTDITDGLILRNRVSSPVTLQLILFQDAFEIVNPLGSAKSKHKLLGFYFTLGNIYPEYRSSVDHIQLLLLCNEKDLKLFGQEVVFKNLLQDLKEIESGFTTNGINYSARVFCITADNLGAHFIGGYVQNFSSAYFCRYCLIKREDWLQQSYPKLTAESRTIENYEATTSENVSDKTGIVFSSCFNNLEHFHVCAPGLPPCIAHDLLEGVCDFDLSLYLNDFIRKGWFSDGELNDFVACFEFSGQEATSKPGFFRYGNKRLNGNACQNWTLIRFLPILLKSKIDVEDDTWRLVLMLREIIEYACSPNISMSQIACFNVLVNEYLEDRKTMFNNVPLRPKHHYLLHHPELTLKFGPLIRLWTLRFESKHSYFKQIMKRSHNFKNVTATLSRKHQLLQAYLLNGSYFEQKCVVENSREYIPEIYTKNITEAIKSVALNEALQICEKIKIFGTTYTIRQFVQLKNNEEDLGCKFGEIIFILTGIKQYFLVKVWDAQWHNDMGLYFCEKTNDVQCIDTQNIGDYYPLIPYKYNSHTVIVLKHKFCN